MKSLVCPHCRTALPDDVSVCTGCGAEIVRGATRRERAGAGCATAIIALLVVLAIVGMRPLPDTGSDEALFLILKLAAVLAVGNLVGRWAMRMLRRSSLRFFRTYRHD
jgi:predicted nucleic acid-binding Zn ribbon protein